MRKIALQLFTIAVFHISNGQEKHFLAFEKMSVADTIFSQWEIDAIRNNNTINDNAGMAYAVKTNIAIGMTLEEVTLCYPNAKFTEKENSYQTCADDNLIGF